MVVDLRLLGVALSSSSSPPLDLFFGSPSRCSKQSEILAFLLVVRSKYMVVLIVLLLFCSDLGPPQGKSLGKRCDMLRSVVYCTHSMISGARFEIHCGILMS